MILVPIVLLLVAGLLLGWQIRKRHMDRWLLAYLARWSRRAPSRDEPIHLLICVADHYEPKYGGAPPEIARARVQKWLEDYPRQFARFHDSDGRTPRHTFFYPIEEYEAEYLDALAELCAAGFGEVEVHLHHEDDTADNLRKTLTEFTQLLAKRHSLLSRHRDTGELAYAFIHGNWCLCNSRPDGRYCGVNEELHILRETGCVVDMTMPSAPSPTQTPKINSIYYASDKPGQRRSNDSGVDVGSAPQPDGSLMLLQGPLLLDWSRRRLGIVPRLENGCLQASQPPTFARVAAWLKARVQVPTRPDWFFVKLHCHGAPEEAHEPLLGEPMVRFHEALAAEAARNPNFQYHYVTAREMFNLARAAEAGWTGTVVDALDYELVRIAEESSNSLLNARGRTQKRPSGTAYEKAAVTPKT